MNKTLQTFGLAALLAGIAMQPTEAYGILKPRIKNSANNVAIRISKKWLKPMKGKNEGGNAAGFVLDG